MTEKYEVRFSFPELERPIEKVLNATVQPLWESDSPAHIIGLFRILVRFTFSDQALATIQPDNATAIHELDVDDDQAYFEYALPFELNDIEDVQSIDATNIKVEISKEQIIQVSWQRNEKYKKQKQTSTQQKVAEQGQQKAVKKPATKQKSSNVFLTDLVEQYSIWHSNDLRPKK